MIKNGDQVKVSLVPKNEAEFPEFVEVEVLKKMPIDDKEVFLAKLLTQTHQDFGYRAGELLLVEVLFEDEKMFAFCEKAVRKV